MNTNTGNKPNHYSRHHSNQSHVIVIGAGWSGLACAVTLTRQGYNVCLLESARHVGGRARSIYFNDHCSDRALSSKTLDNGQHIMLGAYHYTREVFRILGLNEADIFEKQILELKMFSPQSSTMHMKAAPLPAPLHLLAGLLKLKGYTLSERLKAIMMTFKLAISGYTLRQDVSVNDLLLKHKQSPRVISTLWEPLCLATMNTPIQYASGQVFLNVLKDSFSRKRSDSDLLFFRSDLSQIFCTPAVQFITNNGSQVVCASKVIQLQIKTLLSKTTEVSRSTARFCVKTKQQDYQSDYVVLATPAHITEKLLLDSCNQTTEQRQSFLTPKHASLVYSYEPICTIYIQYPEYIKLPQRMIGLFDTLGQWAIDRSLNKQPGLIAIVISGSGKHTELSSEQIFNTIHNELSLIIDDLPTPLDYRIITEKKATFSCRVNIEHRRPMNTTTIPGLYLAGDYTNTGYPSTLEGAIKSGVSAAKHIIKSDHDFTLKENIAKI